MDPKHSNIVEICSEIWQNENQFEEANWPSQTSSDSDDVETWLRDANNNCRACQSNDNLLPDNSLLSQSPILQDDNLDAYFGTDLKKCKAEIRLISTNSFDNDSEDCNEVAVTKSLENCWQAPSNDYAPVVKAKKSTSDTTHGCYQKKTTQKTHLRRKSFEFEDLSKFRSYTDTVYSDELLNCYSSNASSTVSQTSLWEAQHTVGYQREHHDVMYDNPFDPRLQHDPPSMVRQQHRPIFTPLKHVASRNVFLDVAEKISKVMEEYTSQHRSSIVHHTNEETTEQLDDETPRPPESPSGKHRKVCRNKLTE